MDEEKELKDSSGFASQDEIQEELQKAIFQAEENLSGWKRTQADFENYRRRKESESMEWLEMGKQKAFESLLPAIDSLSQALTYAPQLEDEKYMQWKTGLDGIVKQLDSALAESGITKIEAMGKDFDPHKHEAVKEVPGEEGGKVMEELQPGYEMNGRVIRPSQVAISKKE